MNAVSQSLQLMAIGLPVMFGVILLFMVFTSILVKIFPYKEEENQD